MQTKLKVEQADTAALLPYAHNAKEHPDWQVDQIAASIQEFGFNDPIGVWTNPEGQLEIVEGHGRVLAAKQLGLERVPIVKLDHLDDEGRRAYTHVHNRATENTSSDWAVLEQEMAAMPDFDWGGARFQLPRILGLPRPGRNRGRNNNHPRAFRLRSIFSHKDHRRRLARAKSRLVIPRHSLRGRARGGALLPHQPRPAKRGL